MILFTPESPRWLIVTGKEDEARRILIKYHAEDQPDADIIRLEMTEIKETLEVDRDNKSTPWRAWLQGPSNRNRFFIVVTLGFLIQWCGNGVISYYTGVSRFTQRTLLGRLYPVRHIVRRLLINYCPSGSSSWIPSVLPTATLNSS